MIEERTLKVDPSVHERIKQYCRGKFHMKYILGLAVNEYIDRQE